MLMNMRGLVNIHRSVGGLGLLKSKHSAQRECRSNHCNHYIYISFWIK